MNIVFLSTRKELRKFPYYECEQIDNFAQKKSVPVIYDATMIDNNIEYIIVATYHKLVKVENFVKCAVNIHPSFLPAYKGRDPIKDVLRNKEKYYIGLLPGSKNGKVSVGMAFFFEVADDIAEENQDIIFICLL